MIGRIPGMGGEWLKRPLGRFLLLSLVLVAANALFGMTVIRGQSDEILSFQDRIGVAREELGGPASGLSIKGVLAGVEDFKGRVPDLEGLTGVLDDIFKVARKNGLQIPKGDYAPTTVKETDISKYTIRFPVEGFYPQIKRFIYDIEALEHLLVVEEIAFSSSKGDGTIVLRITVSTYFH